MLPGPEADLAAHPDYLGFFECFERRRYFEAHEVLERLWLRTEGEDRAFFQGLIQLAGAFVHLQKQRAHPAHPKHGSRLRPAARLFLRAAENLRPFGPWHLGLDVGRVCGICERYRAELAAGAYRSNPWEERGAPSLRPGGPAGGPVPAGFSSPERMGLAT